MCKIENSPGGGMCESAGKWGSVVVRRPKWQTFKGVKTKGRKRLKV